MPPITVTSRSECRRAGKYIYQITRIRLNSKKVIVKSEKNVSPLEKRWRIHRGPVVVGYRLSCSTSLYIGGHSTTAAPSLCIYTSRGAKRHKNSRTFFLFSFRGEEARSSAGCRQRNKTPRRLFFFPSFFYSLATRRGYSVYPYGLFFSFFFHFVIYFITFQGSDARKSGLLRRPCQVDGLLASHWNCGELVDPRSMNNAFDEGVGRCREIDPPPKCHDFWARRLHRKRKKTQKFCLKVLVLLLIDDWLIASEAWPG